MPVDRAVISSYRCIYQTPCRTCMGYNHRLYTYVTLRLPVPLPSSNLLYHQRGDFQKSRAGRDLVAFPDLAAQAAFFFAVNENPALTNKVFGFGAAGSDAGSLQEIIQFDIIAAESEFHLGLPRTRSPWFMPEDEAVKPAKTFSAEFRYDILKNRALPVPSTELHRPARTFNAWRYFSEVF